MVDPYTFSHLLHGFIFYWPLLPAVAAGDAAGAVHGRWPGRGGLEIAENSSLYVNERYRADMASVDYFVDSILNSTFDLLAAMLGFWIAWKVDWKWVLAAAVAIKLSWAPFVCHKLTLNVLMLVWPSERIKQWQMGG